MELSFHSFGPLGDPADERVTAVIFLGVDQTGAVDGKGRPRPLPSCLLIENQFDLFYLNSFDQSSVSKNVPTSEWSRLLACIDCVMGLPEGVSASWREALNLTLEEPGYGRGPAHRFFRKLGEVPSSERHAPVYQRKVELLCRANSVFQEHPFQKNIQTGTFRFWKEMALDPHWFYAPWIINEGQVDVERSLIPVIEGYPSLAWRLLFQVRVRQPAELKFLLHRFDSNLRWTDFQQKQVERNPNFADALVLALAAQRLHSSDQAEGLCAIQSGVCNIRPSREGWILGAALSLDQQL